MVHGGKGRKEAALSVNGSVAERCLVERASSGDRDAFGELVSRHMRRAYYAALGLVGSHDDALDMSQEAFARAFRARKSLDPERPFYPWLYQILRRLCFNVQRDRRARRARLAEATPWLVEEAGRKSAVADPAWQAENAELRKQLYTAIDRLPSHERETLVLREFEGLRYREIAELLGIPIGTVMSRLYSARKALAKTLREG